MKPVRNWYTDEMEEKQTRNDIKELKEAMIEEAKGRTNKGFSAIIAKGRSKKRPSAIIAKERGKNKFGDNNSREK